MKRAVLAMVLALGLTGCFADNRAVYTSAKVALDFPGESAVAVAVRDARPEIVSGDRRETFIGFQRSLYGIPYAVQTRSEKPFAQEMADLITYGLNADGVETTAVSLSPFDSREEAISTLAASGAPRLLLFELMEWYGDTYVRTTLHYDIRLTVLDAAGRELGKSSLAGEDEIESQQRPERRTIEAATQDILQSLLELRDVVAALSPEARPADAERCTVDQILKMRDSGLSDAQIKAACGEA